MNSSKSFITIALGIAFLVAIIQIGASIFIKPKTTDTYFLPPDRILPDSISMETVENINDRAQKYLSLQYEQLEIGDFPATPSATPTPK